MFPKNTFCGRSKHDLDSSAFDKKMLHKLTMFDTSKPILITGDRAEALVAIEFGKSHFLQIYDGANIPDMSRIKTNLFTSNLLTRKPVAVVLKNCDLLSTTNVKYIVTVLWSLQGVLFQQKKFRMFPIKRKSNVFILVGSSLGTDKFVVSRKVIDLVGMFQKCFTIQQIINLDPVIDSKKNDIFGVITVGVPNIFDQNQRLLPNVLSNFIDHHDLNCVENIVDHLSDMDLLRFNVPQELFDTVHESSWHTTRQNIKHLWQVKEYGFKRSKKNTFKILDSKLVRKMPLEEFSIRAKMCTSQSKYVPPERDTVVAFLHKFTPEGPCHIDSAIFNKCEQHVGELLHNLNTLSDSIFPPPKRVKLES